MAEFMKKGKIDGNARNAWWAKFAGLLSHLSAISFIIAGAPHADAEKFTSGTEQAPLTPTLKTGDYVWKPAVSPAGRRQHSPRAIRAVVSSGTTLIVTDQPVNGTTQSGSNFNILTTSTTSSTQPD